MPKPWKSLPDFTGVVERVFLRRVHLGETLMPFRLLNPLTAVVPFSEGQVLDGSTPEIDDYPKLAAWWRRMEQTWIAKRNPTTTLTLAGQIDYQGKLRLQHPPATVRVIYTGRGSRVAAAVETDVTTLVDHALYWAPVDTVDEGRFLIGLLNSDVLHERTQDFYSRGLLGARNIHKAAFGVPIPAYDPAVAAHNAIVTAVVDAEAIAAQVDLTKGVTATRRRMTRLALDVSGVMERLNSLVAAMLP